MKERSTWVGMTNYSGASLADVLDHVREWREATQSTIGRLHELTASAALTTEDRERLRDYAEPFARTFGGYLRDFDRLVSELPQGVTQAHIALLKQIQEDASHRERSCVLHKNEFYVLANLEREAYPCLDQVYGTIRSQLLDYQDLLNAAVRLETYIGVSTAAGEISVLEALELKPNVAGIGLNLNYILERLRKWWEGRKSKRAA